MMLIWRKQDKTIAEIRREMEMGTVEKKRINDIDDHEVKAFVPAATIRNRLNLGNQEIVSKLVKVIKNALPYDEISSLGATIELDEKFSFILNEDILSKEEKKQIQRALNKSGTELIFSDGSDKVLLGLSPIRQHAYNLQTCAAVSAAIDECNEKMMKATEFTEAVYEKEFQSRLAFSAFFVRARNAGYSVHISGHKKVKVTLDQKKCR